MSPENRKWDLETDLLVIGAGAAGMTAALVGALEGLKTVICEKSDMVGGTTATSAGTVWIPGSRQSEAAGVPDSIASAKTYLAAILGEDANDARLAAYLATGPAVLDYLAQRTSVAFAPPPVHPDYLAHPGAATGGRALGALPFDGRKLGDDFTRVRPPRREFMVLGGMMVGKTDIPSLLHPFRSLANFVNATRLLARQALDRINHTRGTRLIMGNALVARLLDSLKQNAVEIRYQTQLSELIDGRRKNRRRCLHDKRWRHLPFAREKASCWRPGASAGVANCAIGYFRKGRSVIRWRPTAIRATAFSPPNARMARSRRM